MYVALHEHAFLQHAHPDVSLIVFYDAGYLALGQVHQSAEERVILQESGLRVIYIDAQSVAADIELVIAADIDVFDGQVSDAADSGKDVASCPEQMYALVLAGEIEVAQDVLLDILCVHAFGTGKVGGDSTVCFLAVEFSVFGDDPESAPFIFQEFVDIFQFFHLSLHGMAFLFILLFEHDAITGCSHGYVFIL